MVEVPCGCDLEEHRYVVVLQSDAPLNLGFVFRVSSFNKTLTVGFRFITYYVVYLYSKTNDMIKKLREFLFGVIQEGEKLDIPKPKELRTFNHVEVERWCKEFQVGYLYEKRVIHFE